VNNPEHSPSTRFAQIDVDFATAKRLSDRLAETFEEISVAAMEIAANCWRVEAHFPAGFDEISFTGVVAEAVGPRAAKSLLFGAIAARDWVAASLAGLPPVAAGRFVVHGQHDRARVRHAYIPIEIEAALAFGTGHHGTTRGCLIAFDRLLRSHRPRRVLDVGTGTGVLAIAAARALHCAVVASDIDRVALQVARENARLNHVAPLIRFVHTPGVAARELRANAPYDLIFANILLSPLRQFAVSLKCLLAARGRLILSGLLRDQANAALAIYRQQGLLLERCIAIEGWTTLVLRRSA
jgi:ribosomal protein L11 methyltransferase